MSKPTKMRKREVGQSKPTENRTHNSITQRRVSYWYDKVIQARNNEEEVGDKIKAVANVLFELSECIKRGEEEVEVITELIKKENMKASLEILTTKLRTMPVLGGR